jgi:hypothetical protein
MSMNPNTQRTPQWVETNSQQVSATEYETLKPSIPQSLSALCACCCANELLLKDKWTVG